MTCLISIIVLCRNNNVELIETLRSIQRQKFRNYQVVIIDGSENDKCWEVFHRENFEFSAVYLRELYALGIYGAMNLAVDLSVGRFLIFLNSGDVFFDETVALDFSIFVDASNLGSSYSVVGSAHCVNSGSDVGWFIPPPTKVTEYFQRGFMPIHQAIFFAKEFAETNKYDERLPYYADHIVKKALIESELFKFMDRVVVTYDVEGVSGVAPRFSVLVKMLKESRPLSNKLYQLVKFLAAKVFGIAMLRKILVILRWLRFG